jgi:hypothetical protein
MQLLSKIQRAGCEGVLWTRFNSIVARNLHRKGLIEFRKGSLREAKAWVRTGMRFVAAASSMHGIHRRLRLQPLDRVQDPMPRLGAGRFASCTRWLPSQTSMAASSPPASRRSARAWASSSLSQSISPVDPTRSAESR